MEKTALPRFLTIEERDEQESDAELVDLWLSQKDLTHEKVKTVGSKASAPQDQRDEHSRLYNRYDTRRRELYDEVCFPPKRVLMTQVLRQKRMDIADRDLTAGSTSIPDVDEQWDALPTAEDVENEISVAIASIDVDFQDPAAVVALVTGEYDPEAAVEHFEATTSKLAPLDPTMTSGDTRQRQHNRPVIRSH